MTREEWEALKQHSRIGYEKLRAIPSLSEVASIVHAHHERYDGKGYPRGLAGAEIPLAARIIAVIDSFFAMTNDRPYRKALPPEVARGEILRNSGGQFDPEVVQAFMAAYEAASAARTSSEPRDDSLGEVRTTA